MCDAITPSNELDGEVLVLCAGERVRHMMRWLEIPDIDPDTPDGEPKHIPAARQLLEQFAVSARCVVMEEFYFDIDYRSESALLQPHQFNYVEPSVDRIHFFSEDYRDEESLYDFVSRMRDLAVKREKRPPKRPRAPVHLGYSTIRPRREGKIGRSLVTPWTSVRFRAPVDLDGRDIEHPYKARGGAIKIRRVHDQVRTAVPEQVTLYGVDFRVVGVPFMEQDGNLLRCAHVSAWICHYLAVLRGLSGRRTTSQLHLAGNTINAIARPYPSNGLSVVELATLLRSVSLAPEVLGFHDLVEPRTPTWSDRAELRTKHETLSQDDVDGKLSEHGLFWLRENVSATICRYLNSGLPVILARASLGEGHTQVVVGYLRESDLGIESSPDDSHSDVVAFIVSDDQAGPFQLVYLSEIVEELANRRATTHLVVPLPESVWVSSEMAERIGAAQILRAARARLTRAEKWHVLPDTERAQVTKALETFMEGLSPETTGLDTFSIRTYVCIGSDFKRSAAKRMGADRALVSAIGRTQLPRFVWVCEVIDRALRSRGDTAAVVATVVLDTTQLISEALETQAADELTPLFIQIPTQYFASPFLQAETVDPGPKAEERWEIPDRGKIRGRGGESLGSAPRRKDGFWRRTDIEPYFTGRWSHERLNARTSAELMGDAKSSLV